MVERRMRDGKHEDVSSLFVRTSLGHKVYPVDFLPVVLPIFPSFGTGNFKHPGGALFEPRRGLGQSRAGFTPNPGGFPKQPRRGSRASARIRTREPRRFSEVAPLSEFIPRVPHHIHSKRVKKEIVWQVFLRGGAFFDRVKALWQVLHMLHWIRVAER